MRLRGIVQIDDAPGMEPADIGIERTAEVIFFSRRKKHLQLRMGQVIRLQERHGKGHPDPVVSAQGRLSARRDQIPLLDSPDRIFVKIVRHMGCLLAYHIKMGLQQEARLLFPSRRSFFPEVQVMELVLPTGNPACFRPGKDCITQCLFLKRRMRDPADSQEMPKDRIFCQSCGISFFFVVFLHFKSLPHDFQGRKSCRDPGRQAVLSKHKTDRKYMADAAAAGSHASKARMSPLYQISSRRQTP